jgi:hypothetical protein
VRVSGIETSAPEREVLPSSCFEPRFRPGAHRVGGEPVQRPGVDDVVMVGLPVLVRPHEQVVGLLNEPHELDRPRLAPVTAHHLERDPHRDRESAGPQLPDALPLRRVGRVLAGVLVVRAQRRCGEEVAESERPARPQVYLHLVVGIEADIVGVLVRDDLAGLLGVERDVERAVVAENVHVGLLARHHLVAQVELELHVLRRLPRLIAQRAVDRRAFGDVRNRQIGARRDRRRGGGGKEGDEDDQHGRKRNE